MEYKYAKYKVQWKKKLSKRAQNMLTIQKQTFFSCYWKHAEKGKLHVYLYIYLSIYIFFNEVLGYFLQCQKTVTVMFSVWLCLDQGFIGPCVLKYTHWQSSSYCKSYFFIPVLKTCFLPGALEVIMQTPSPKLSELLRAEKSTVQLSV